MSNPKRTASQQLESLVDAYLKDLLDVADDDLLQDAPVTPKDAAGFEEVIKKATAEAGRRRLARARLELQKRPAIAAQEPVDLAEARRFLAEAANDKRITLAARDLRELPDEEVRRLYLQLQQLQTAARNAKNDES